MSQQSVIDAFRGINQNDPAPSNIEFAFTHFMQLTASIHMMDINEAGKKASNHY